MPTALRVLIVDDHLIFRMGLKTLLSAEPDIEVAGEAATVNQAIEKFRELRPDVVVLDLRMPGGGGMAALSAICAADENARVLMLSSFGCEEEVYQALNAGALGYVLKDVGREELVRAVRHIAAGKKWIQESVRFVMAERAGRPNLTPRELEVLSLLVRGLTNREIGAVLKVSENTVRNHTISVFSKLEVSDRAEAVSVALQRGIVVPNA